MIVGRGGRRTGAGRPKGSGKFGEPTKAVRLPLSMVPQVLGYVDRKGLALPIYSTKAQANYPEHSFQIPADNFDMTKHLVPHPDDTFYVRNHSDAMAGAGINDNDILIVDKSVEPRNGDIIVFTKNGEFMVRRYLIKNKKIELKPEHPKFATIKVPENTTLNIWGIVRTVIHSI